MGSKSKKLVGAVALMAAGSTMAFALSFELFDYTLKIPSLISIFDYLHYIDAFVPGCLLMLAGVALLAPQMKRNKLSSKPLVIEALALLALTSLFILIRYIYGNSDVIDVIAVNKALYAVALTLVIPPVCFSASAFAFAKLAEQLPAMKPLAWSHVVLFFASTLLLMIYALFYSFLGKAPAEEVLEIQWISDLFRWTVLTMALTAVAIVICWWLAVIRLLKLSPADQPSQSSNDQPSQSPTDQPSQSPSETPPENAPEPSSDDDAYLEILNDLKVLNDLNDLKAPKESEVPKEIDKNDHSRFMPKQPLNITPNQNERQ